MEAIHSIKNQKVKELAKLKLAKYRKQHQAYLIEGPHLIDMALHSGVVFKYVLISEDKQSQYENYIEQFNEKVLLVNQSILAYLGDTETTQGILACVKHAQPVSSKETSSRCLVLDSVQDPGNLGTMIRTADAAGFSHIILGNGCVDCYNSKVLRSAQGSHFYMNIETANLLEWIPEKQKQGIQCFAAALDDKALDYQVVKGHKKIAIIVGNEGNGISKEILELVDKKVMIPIYGQAESLNVAIAAALLMYKAQEQ